MCSVCVINDISSMDQYVNRKSLRTDWLCGVGAKTNIDVVLLCTIISTLCTYFRYGQVASQDPRGEKA